MAIYTSGAMCNCVWIDGLARYGVETKKQSIAERHMHCWDKCNQKKMGTLNENTIFVSFIARLPPLRSPIAHTCTHTHNRACRRRWRRHRHRCSHWHIDKNYIADKIYELFKRRPEADAVQEEKNKIQCIWCIREDEAKKKAKEKAK